MLVTDDRLLAGRDPVKVAEAAVRGGVTAVQLRLKEAGPREVLDLARRLKAGLSVPVLVNDRPDIGLLSGCGVHLGPDDLPVSAARRLLGAGTLIGGSVGSDEEALGAAEADYWGVGPLNGSATKRDAGGAIGVEGFHRIALLSGGRPCLAIGGVRPGDVRGVLAAGGNGVAVISGILSRDDVEAAAREYAVEFEKC
jgi:thiamine-phosphate pyrophosphorylase